MNLPACAASRSPRFRQTAPRRQPAFAKAYFNPAVGGVLLLKGAGTVITDGETVLCNPTGSTALSKGGTGDTLCGMVCAFLAEGAKPLDAAMLAAYIHGLAGERAAEVYSDYGVLARDVSTFAAKVLREIDKVNSLFYRKESAIQFDPASKKLRIDAAELCHTVVNHADIDRRAARIREDDGKVDELLESRHGTNYHTKQALCRTVSRGGLFYEISGTADGILRESGKTTVCVNRLYGGYTSELSADRTAETVALAALLAYMVAESEMLGTVTFCVTFFHNSRDVRTIEKRFSRRELSEAVLRLIDLHRPFAALVEAERLCVRIPNCKTLAFPYPAMRPQRRDFIVETLRAIGGGKKALIEAPTGTGKTVAALYPALRALGAGMIDKIFYFTSKNTTALAALDAARKMSAATGIRAVHITAKERICPVKLRDPMQVYARRLPARQGAFRARAGCACRPRRCGAHLRCRHNSRCGRPPQRLPLRVVPRPLGGVRHRHLRLQLSD